MRTLADRFCALAFLALWLLYFVGLPGAILFAGFVLAVKAALFFILG